MIPRNQINPVVLWSAVKLAGSRRPVGAGETHGVFLEGARRAEPGEGLAQRLDTDPRRQRV